MSMARAGGPILAAERSHAQQRNQHPAPLVGVDRLEQRLLLHGSNGQIMASEVTRPPSGAARIWSQSALISCTSK